jgi:hypothetical protein
MTGGLLLQIHHLSQNWLEVHAEGRTLAFWKIDLSEGKFISEPTFSIDEIGPQTQHISAVPISQQRAEVRSEPLLASGATRL